MTEQVDRLSKGYEPRFDIDYAVGLEGEEKVLNLLDGIRLGTVEVKNDVRASDTGNLYIEFECRGKPSGIQTTEADAWAFVLGGGASVTIIPTNLLHYLYTQLLDHKKYCREMNRGARPTKGVLLPLSKLTELTILAKKAIEEKK